MDKVVKQTIKKVKTKLDKILQDPEKVSIKYKLQKEFNIPLEDIQNIILKGTNEINN